MKTKIILKSKDQWFIEKHHTSNLIPIDIEDKTRIKELTRSLGLKSQVHSNKAIIIGENGESIEIMYKTVIPHSYKLVKDFSIMLNEYKGMRFTLPKEYILMDAPDKKKVKTSLFNDNRFVNLISKFAKEYIGTDNKGKEIYNDKSLLLYYLTPDIRYCI